MWYSVSILSPHGGKTKKKKAGGGVSWWLSGKESVCQCRRSKRHRFNPWGRKIPDSMCASWVAQLVKNPPAMQETLV